MNRYYALITAETRDPDAPVGAILLVVNMDHRHVLGADRPVLVEADVLAGDRVFRLPARTFTLIDAAQAKRLRVARKRDADRQAPTWRGPR